MEKKVKKEKKTKLKESKEASDDLKKKKKKKKDAKLVEEQPDLLMQSNSNDYNELLSPDQESKTLVSSLANSNNFVQVICLFQFFFPLKKII